MAGQPFDPVKARVLQWMLGVEPKSLRAREEKHVLLRSRLNLQRDLQEKGTARDTPIWVSPEGVVQDGHHACRVAIEFGEAVDVVVSPLSDRMGEPIENLLIVEDE